MHITRRGFLSTVGVGGCGSVQAIDEHQPPADQRTSNPGVDVGAVYIPFLGSKWGRCVDHEPAVGQYDIDDLPAINQHIKWMRENGISTVMFNFGESHKSFDRFQAFQQAELVDDIKIEVFWPINRVFQRDLDLERILDFVRDEFLKRDNYKRYDGRPVIQFWAAAYLRHHDPTRKHIVDDYGSLAAFVDHIRDRLTVDGIDPYLIAHEPAPSTRPAYARAYDGYTDWFGPLTRLGKPTWQEFLNAKRKIANRVTSFAADYDKDFLPMVMPGFDDRPNECWGEDRHVPRSPAHLADMFEFADEYRTRNRVNLATFNDWPEGHQIEPGTFSGSEYELDYLRVVKNYVERSIPTPSPSPSATPTQTKALSPTMTPTTAETNIQTQKGTTTTVDTPGLSLLTGLIGVAAGAVAHWLLNSDQERNS